MADIIITPGSSLMSFTSSLNYTQTLTQEASGSLTLQGSGSTGRTDLFTVNGNNGTLFSVSDDLSNSLFSVNTIAGLPVIEAFADNTVVMGQYGQNVLVVTGSRVGIGTATPSSRLHLQGTTTLLTITDTSFNRTSNIGYVDSANLYFANDSNSNTFIGAYNNLFLAYGGGNVGIGTTNPSFKLDVVGSLRASNSITNEANHNNTRYENILPAAANGSGAGIAQMAWWVSEPGISWNNGGFGYNVTNNGASPYGFGRINNSFGQAYMRFDASGYWYFYNTNTSGTRVETMTLTDTGRVGIGTTGPAEKLHVDGNLRLGTNPTISWSSNTLNIQTATDAIGVVRINGSTSYSPRFEIWNANNAANVIFFDAGGNSFINSGNVGIGTTSPSAKLDVDGSVNVKGGIVGRNSSNTVRYEFAPELAYTQVGVAAGLGTYKINSGAASLTSMLRLKSTSTAGWLEGIQRYFNGTVISDGLCAEAIPTAGTLVFLTPDAEWGIADADVGAKSVTLLGIALNSTSGIGETVHVMIDGIISLYSNHDQITIPASPGAPLFVSTNAGNITEVAPSGTGDIVRLVGHNIWSTTSGQDAAIIRFQPDNTWIEL